MRPTNVVGQLVTAVALGHLAICVHVLSDVLATWEAVQDLLVGRCRWARNEALVVKQNLDGACVNSGERLKFATKVVLRIHNDAVVDKVTVDDVREPLREREAHASVRVCEELLHTLQFVAVLLTCVGVGFGAIRLTCLRHDLLQDVWREAPRPLQSDHCVLCDLDTALHYVYVIGQTFEH